MSDNGMPSRAELAGSITAELERTDTVETPPPAETTPAAEEAQQATTQPETPAPVVQQDAPKAIAHADTDLVIDPADGKERTWGEIKAERLRQADYTKKTMALAEERRAVEAMKAQMLLEQQTAQLRAQQAALPPLPEDDPYAQNLKAQQAQLDAIAQYQLTMQQQMKDDLAAREMAASRAALEAEEKRLSAEYGLNEREIGLVEREYFLRAQQGESVTFDSIAKEHQQYVASLKEQALREFKEKHRVGSAPAAPAAPAAAPADKLPQQGTREHRDWVRDMFAESFR